MSVAEDRWQAALPAAPVLVPAQLQWPRPGRTVVCGQWLGAHADNPVRRAADLEDAAGALAELTDAGLLEVAAAAEKIASWAKAVQVRALAALDARFEADGAGEFTADQVAAVLRWGTRAGQARLHEATALVDRLPCTLALLATGDLDYPRARTIVTGTDELTAEQAAAVDAAVAADAPQLTNAQVRDRVALEATAVDAAAAARRHAAGRRDRRVVPNPLRDGIAELIVTGPAQDIATIYTAIDGLAHAAERSDGIDAARFDALTSWAQRVLDDVAAGRPPAPEGGRWAGSRPHILLTIAAPTLLGLDDAPCHLAGYGYLPADVARAIAEHGGALRRIFTDPVTGLLLGVDGHTYPAPAALAESARLLSWPGRHHDDGDGDIPGGRDPGTGGPGSGGPGHPRGGPMTPPGTPAAPVPAPAGCADPPDASGRRRRYRPSAALARLVRARYRCCTYPGCARPADRCDLDHGRAWPLGPTCACNLHPLCRRHHRLKHSGHLHLHLGPDGTLTWTLRSGHFRTTGPPPVLARPTVPAARAAVTEDPPEPPPPPGHDAARWGARALRAVLQPPPAPAKAPPDDPGPPPF